jgi:hypothetical protein
MPPSLRTPPGAWPLTPTKTPPWDPYKLIPVPVSVTLQSPLQNSSPITPHPKSPSLLSPAPSSTEGGVEEAPETTEPLPFQREPSSIPPRTTQNLQWRLCPHGAQSLSKVRPHWVRPQTFPNSCSPRPALSAPGQRLPFKASAPG